MKILTQKTVAFYILWKAHKETPGQLVPAWRFVGEIDIPELGATFLMSYKGPTNGLKIYEENPNLIAREWMKGKSGSTFYGYKIKMDANRDSIDDPNLRNFYDKLKAGRRHRELEESIASQLEDYSQPGLIVKI